MKFTLISIIIAVVLVGGALVMTRPTDEGSFDAGSNVTLIDGKQIINLRTKGGFSPLSSSAKAGVPTILKVSTKGTFDCSSVLRIPSLNIFKNLPPSGTTEIDLGSPQVGVLQGTCGMGMYPFEIDFQG